MAGKESSKGLVSLLTGLVAGDNLIITVCTIMTVRSNVSNHDNNPATSMWQEIKIPLPEDVLARVFPPQRGGPRGDDARNITAHLNELAGYPLPNQFFNYNDKGQPLNGRPPVRFGSFSRGISVQGVGVQGCDLLRSCGHHVRHLWSVKNDVPLREVRSSGRNAISWSPRPIDYFVHQMAVDPPKQWLHLGKEAKFDVQDLKPLLQESIKRSLMAEIRCLHGEDPSIDGSEVLSQWDDVRIDVIDVARLGFHPTHTSRASKAVLPAVKHVRFRAAIKLDGIWHVGRMSSRGLGLVRRFDADRPILTAGSAAQCQLQEGSL